MTTENTKNKQGVRHILRKTAATFALLAGGFFTNTAHAYTDGPALAQRAIEFIKTEARAIQAHADSALQYARQGLQYTKQIQQLQELVSTLQNLSLSSFLPQGELKAISDEDGYANQACPARGSLASQAVEGVIDMFTPSVDLTSNLAKSQLKLCKEIAKLQVKKYNASIEMLKTLNQRNGDALQQLSDRLSKLTNLGDASKAAADASSTLTALTGEANSWTAYLQTYDNAIKTMQDMQSQLAKMSLQGKDNLAGNLVQSVVMGAVLTRH